MGAEWRPVNRPNGGNTGLANGGYGNQGYQTTPNYTNGGDTWQNDPPEPTHSTDGPNEAAQPAPTAAAPPRWYEPTGQPRPNKVLVGSQDVRQLIAGAVGSRLAEDFRLFLGDNDYYLAPLADAREIITNSGLARASYLPETFDCDDFAMVLKAHFCEAAYKNFERRPPHCFGLIWGELPHVHALNWMINDDYRFRLIEPQTGEIFELRTDSRNITFMLA